MVLLEPHLFKEITLIILGELGKLQSFKEII